MIVITTVSLHKLVPKIAVGVVRSKRSEQYKTVLNTPTAGHKKNTMPNATK